MPRPLAEYSTSQLLRMLPLEDLEALAGITRTAAVPVPQVDEIPGVSSVLPQAGAEQDQAAGFDYGTGAVAPQRAFGGVPSLSQGNPDDNAPSLLQRLLGLKPSISQQNAAQAVVAVEAMDQGLTVPQLKEKITGKASDVHGQFMKAAVNEMLMGLPNAVAEARGDAPDVPQTTAENIAAGGGKLLGFILGAPGAVTKFVTKKMLGAAPGLALTGTEETALRAGKLAATEAVGLGAGMGAASVGEALQQDSLEDAFKVMGKAGVGGATMGATFGATRGIFPDPGMTARIKRIAAGLVVLDAQRMQNPFDDREIAQKVFDYGMDVYFLWRGLPKNQFKKFEKGIDAQATEAEKQAAQQQEQGQGSYGTDGRITPSESNSNISDVITGSDVNNLQKYDGAPNTNSVNEGQGTTIAKTPDVLAAEAAQAEALQRMEKIRISKLPEYQQPEPLALPDAQGKLPDVQGKLPDKAADGGMVPGDVSVGSTAPVLGLPEPGTTPDLKPAAQPQASPSLDKGKFPVERVQVADIKADPGKFQFKQDVNEKGEQRPLQGEWNDLASGNFLLWQANDGTLYVANGHHRLAHAERMGQKEINAQILKESDGYTVKDARNLAAEANILEGKGTIYDHADYFRTTDGYDDALAGKRGIKGRGYTIGKNASDQVYNSFKKGDMSPEHAEAIAQAAPKDEVLQGIGAKYSADHPKADTNTVKNYIRAMAFEQKNPQKGSGDLFGYDDTAFKNAEAQAKEVSRIIKDLKEEKQAISMVKSDKKIGLAEKHGIDVSDKEAVRKRIADIDSEIDSWEKWYTNPELVKIVRERAGIAPKSEAPPNVDQEPPKAENVKQEGKEKAEPAKSEPKEDILSQRKREKAEERGDRDKQESLDGLGEKDTFGLSPDDSTVHGGKSEPKPKPPPESGNLFSKGGPHANRERETQAPPKKEPTTTEERSEYAGRERTFMDMPEIVEIARSIADNIPRVRKLAKRLIAKGVQGFMSPKDGKITLSKAIFKNPVEAAKVMAHEIGHLVDWLPDKTMKRGNILGRIATLKKYGERLLEEYPGSPNKILTKDDEARFRAEAEAAAKAAERPEVTRVETIMKEVPKFETTGVTPEMILDLMRGKVDRSLSPELFEFLQRANTQVKKEIIKKALKDMVDDRASQFGQRRQVGTEFVEETVTTTIPGKKATKAEIRRRFEELWQQEIEKRHLYEIKKISEELRNLTQIWRPFAVDGPGSDAKYTAYRHSSKELYSDAISVLMNDPALLKRVAPTFNEAFFNHLESKPDMKRAYDDIQQRLMDRDAVLAERDKRSREMSQTGEELQKQMDEKQEKITLSNILREIKKALIDVNAELRVKVDKALKKGVKIEDAKNPKYLTEELPYISSEVFDHIRRLDSEIMEPMKADGITVEDMGEYMKYRRIATDRAEVGPDRKPIANPGGHTKETALEQLDFLKKQMGDEKFNKLVGYATKFWEFRQAVIEKIRDANMFSPALMDKIERNENYATFKIFLENEYGRNATNHITGMIHKQEGTLADVRNPFVATVMKDMALIRAAEITTTKKALVDMMHKGFGDEIKDAETRWNGKYNEPIESKNPDEAMIMYLEGGKVVAKYVPKGLAEQFNHAPYEAGHLMKLWNLVNVPLRALLVNRNPLWMAFNLPRDFMGTVKNIPGLTAPKLVQYYGKVLGDAWKERKVGSPTALGSEMLQKKMLVTGRQYELTDVPGETQLDRTLQTFGKSPVQYRNKVVRPLVALWDALGNIGQFTERLGKMAGYAYLKDVQAGKVEGKGLFHNGEFKDTLTDARIAHIVRSRVGTPDFYRRGGWNVITNNLFMFSNVAKEGFRASWESAKEAKAEYAWKTVKFNLAPKAIFAAALAGFAGQTIQRICQSVSDYQKENYNIVPIGISDLGKGVYLTLPQDYTGQVIGGLAWNLMHGEIMGKGGFTAYGASNSPYNLHPFISAGADLLDYYGKGINPKNDFTGGNVIGEQAFKAGGWAANKDMLKATAKELGGSMFYTFRGNEVDRVESDFEKALRLPGMNVLGKFIKVSTYGIKEDYHKTTAEVAKEEARGQLASKDAIVEHINKFAAQGSPARPGDISGLYREMKQKGLIERDVSFGQFRHRYERIESKVPDNPEFEAVANAGSNRQKAALLTRYQTDLSPADYAKIENMLRKEGFLTEGLRREVLNMKRKKQ